jgi:hypothetical protein
MRLMTEYHENPMLNHVKDGLQAEGAVSLDDLITTSAAWDAEFSETRLSAEELKFHPDGVVVAGELLRMDQQSRSRFFAKIGAPARYFENHSPAFQSAALAEHAARKDFGQKPTLVLRGGELVTIVCRPRKRHSRVAGAGKDDLAELLSLPNADVIRSVVEGLGKESEGLTVARIGLDQERMDVELVSPSKSITVRPGDVVQSGLHIIHQRFGNQATLIEAFAYRLICSNGMTRRECVRDAAWRSKTGTACKPSLMPCGQPASAMPASRNCSRVGFNEQGSPCRPCCPGCSPRGVKKAPKTPTTAP